MSEPVRAIGHVTQPAADFPLTVGVDHGTVTIGKPDMFWRLDATARDQFARLYFDAEAEAEKWQQERDCPRCEGCGQLADSDEQEPWTAWQNLPLRSAAAVVSGLVKPITCHICKGTGKAPS